MGIRANGKKGYVREAFDVTQQPVEVLPNLGRGGFNATVRFECGRFLTVAKKRLKPLGPKSTGEQNARTR